MNNNTWDFIREFVNSTGIILAFVIAIYNNIATLKKIKERDSAWKIHLEDVINGFKNTMESGHNIMHTISNAYIESSVKRDTLFLETLSSITERNNKMFYEFQKELNQISSSLEITNDNIMHLNKELKELKELYKSQSCRIDAILLKR